MLNMTSENDIPSGKKFDKGIGDGVSNMDLEKLEHKGYLVPSFTLDANNSMLTLMRFVQPRPLQVGSMGLSISKTVIKGGITITNSQFSMIRDEQLIIVVTVKNTGNLPIGIIEDNDTAQPFGLQIIDNEGFEQHGFNVDEGVYSYDTMASFIGMAPLADPKIVVAVVLDSPNGELDDGADLSLGGASAAPVFAEVAQDALHQLGVAPDRR